MVVVLERGADGCSGERIWSCPILSFKLNKFIVVIILLKLRIRCSNKNILFTTIATTHSNISGERQTAEPILRQNFEPNGFQPSSQSYVTKFPIF